MVQWFHLLWKLKHLTWVLDPSCGMRGQLPDDNWDLRNVELSSLELFLSHLPAFGSGMGGYLFWRRFFLFLFLRVMRKGCSSTEASFLGFDSCKCGDTVPPLICKHPQYSERIKGVFLSNVVLISCLAEFCLLSRLSKNYCGKPGWKGENNLQGLNPAG